MCHVSDVLLGHFSTWGPAGGREMFKMKFLFLFSLPRPFLSLRQSHTVQAVSENDLGLVLPHLPSTGLIDSTAMPGFYSSGG